MDEATERILVQKVTEIHTVVLGIPDTAEGGLVKDIKHIKEECQRHREVEVEHAEAIAVINGRCLERGRNETNQGPIDQGTKTRKQALLLGLLVVAATVFSAAVYGIIELIKL
jgi:hypothetical protein